MKKIIFGVFVVLIILCFINQPIQADNNEINNCDNPEYIGSADITIWFTDTYDVIYWGECFDAWIMPVQRDSSAW